MSKSIYTLDMRKDIDKTGGGGGASKASEVEYTNTSGSKTNVQSALSTVESDLGSAEADIATLQSDVNSFQFREQDGTAQYKLESEGADAWRPFSQGGELPDTYAMIFNAVTYCICTATNTLEASTSRDIVSLQDDNFVLGNAGGVYITVKNSGIYDVMKIGENGVQSIETLILSANSKIELTGTTSNKFYGIIVFKKN